jgi:DNA excision repair protein ERCC-2
MTSIQDQKEVFLTVHDLVIQPPKRRSAHLHIPRSQRGQLGKSVQRRIQQNEAGVNMLASHEYGVNLELSYMNYKFLISGKIDGVLITDKSIEIEEIKSVILKPAEFRILKLKNLSHYTEQLYFYCYLLHHKYPASRIIPYLKLFNVTNDRLRSFKLNYVHSETEKLLFERLDLFIDRRLNQKSLIHHRKSILNRFQYPLAEERPQQKEMMKAVHTAITQRQNLLISAPTGTGKTAAALYPVISYALSEGKRVFYATAKNTQQDIVAETLKPFKNNNLSFIAVFLRAARNLCLNDIFFCHEDYCPFVANFSEKLEQTGIRETLVVDEIISTDKIISLASAHLICPSELLISLSNSADCVVGDFNYIIEPGSAMQHYLMNEQAENWILIIDEVHHLYQRALDHLTVALRRSEVSQLLKFLAGRRAKLYQEFKQPLRSLLNILEKFQTEGKTAYPEFTYFEINLDSDEIVRVFEQFEGAYLRYQIAKTKHKSIPTDDPVESFYYHLRRYVYVLRRADDYFRTYYTALKGGALHIQCCDPSSYLSQILVRFHSVIAMSATLEPFEFYKNVLGMNDTVSLDSPFSTTNRRIVIIPGISTRFAERQKNYPRYAEIIKNVITIRSGNYIVFYPSFEFLQNVNLFLGETGYFKYFQRPQMSEQEREQLLQDFANTDHPQLMFAVLGGIFAESIDLSGNRCIGVIIFSPALPKTSFERELIRNYYDQKSTNGFEYAYLIPGISNVIQAAGRLIRSNSDKGIIVIVGERFAEDRINHLLPDYWFQKPGDLVITNDYITEITSFWRSINSI